MNKMIRRTALAVAMSLCTVSVGTVATAHEWYPIECCSGLDCAPVTKVEYIQQTAGAGLPIMVVTTVHGSVPVPANFPRREAKDGQMHACMRPTSDGGMRLLCLFMPSGS